MHFKLYQLLDFFSKMFFILELLYKIIIKQTLKTLYKINQNTLNLFLKHLVFKTIFLQNLLNMFSKLELKSKHIH